MPDKQKMINSNIYNVHFRSNPLMNLYTFATVQLVFKTGHRFNAGQKHCRMLQERILQYFRPALSYHLSLRFLFFLFLSGRLRQVLQQL